MTHSTTARANSTPAVPPPPGSRRRRFGARTAVAGTVAALALALPAGAFAYDVGAKGDAAPTAKKGSFDITKQGSFDVAKKGSFDLTKKGSFDLT